MNRRSPLRRPACLALTAAAALGVLLAPPASADDETDELPGRVSESNGVAPGQVPSVPPLGRKWG